LELSRRGERLDLALPHPPEHLLRPSAAKPPPRRGSPDAGDVGFPGQVAGSLVASLHRENARAARLARADRVSSLLGRRFLAPRGGRDPRRRRGGVPGAPLPRAPPSAEGARIFGNVLAGGGAMKATCADLERALSGGEPELFSAFEAHTQSCAKCAAEL